MKNDEIDNQINAERLSALMDGELSSEELDELLDAVDEEPKLKQLWRSMNVAEGVRLKASQSELDTDISLDVMAEIRNLPKDQSEPASEAVIAFPKGPSTAEKTLSKGPEKIEKGAGHQVFTHLAVAASVAMFTLLIWNIWGGNQGQLIGSPNQAQISSLDLNNPRDGLARTVSLNEKPSHTPVAINQTVQLVSKTSPEPQSFSIRDGKYTTNTLSEKEWQQLAPYVMAHSARSVNPVGSSVITLTRVVDPQSMSQSVQKVLVEKEGQAK